MNGLSQNIFQVTCFCKQILSTASTTLLVTFDVRSKSKRNSCLNLRPKSLTADQQNGYLYCVAKNAGMLSVKPTHAPSLSSIFYADEVVTIPSHQALPSGLAISTKHRLLFSAIDDYFTSYSLDTFQTKRQWLINSNEDRRKCTVLDCHNGYLYYSGCGNKTLKRVPIDHKGNLVMERNVTLISDFQDLRDIAFDHFGNILASDRQSECVQVSFLKKFHLFTF